MTGLFFFSAVLLVWVFATLCFWPVLSRRFSFFRRRIRAWCQWLTWRSCGVRPTIMRAGVLDVRRWRDRF